MKSRKNNRRPRVFSKKNYLSNDGMMTTVWGPSMWHYMHAMSFNYPVNPSADQKKHYKNFVLNLQHTLPCGACRKNLTNNFKAHPLKACHLKNRTTFSRYIYDLHEVVNKMLGKDSGLTYCQVRERYEHFRARCIENKLKKFNFRNKTAKKKKEKGCTEPLYGKKAKCIIKIVPQDHKCKTLQIHNKCLKSRKRTTK